MADDTRGSASSAPAPVEEEEDAASLASAVLDEEAKREAEQIARSTKQVLPDDLLPGVGADQMSFRDGVKAGGVGVVTLIPLIALVGEFDRVAIAVLAPDIQNTLNVSDTVLIGIASFGGIALVLGAIPLAWLADRLKRVRIVGFATIFWGLGVFFQGLAVNPFQMFCARAFTGLGQSSHLPVHSALLADAYPVQARGRVFAVDGMARPLGLLAGPFLAGFIADTAGGDEGWRWAFYIFAIPPILLGLITFFLKEPARGHNEQLMVLGTELEPANTGKELPVSISSAFARLKKIRTFYYICVGIGTLGFALVAAPIQISKLLEESYGKEAFDRGWIISLTWLASLVSIPISGAFMDKLFRKDPQKMVRAAGGFILAYGVVMAISLRFTSLWPLIIGISLANACTSAAFVSIGPTVGAVAPYRMRAQAFAIVPLFIFLMGGFFGGLIAGALSDSFGERTSLTVVIPPAALAGGLLIMYGSRFMKRDISLAVEELIEEQDEMKRMSADPEHIPALQLRNLDYSYGPVQVLFDVGFEVEKGEVLALLGNNGAGKSTVLRAISGLGIPDRGVIRLHGRTLTYVDAEVRFGQGIVQLRGGSGIFPELTIDDNLRSAMLATKVDDKELDERLAGVMTLFPMLANRRGELARSLSGGQQQMLALAMALMHKPEVLLIDELSLGLAPVVVQELIGVVERLKGEGQTMVIVEQSLNIALTLADRAVFMEKGRVRFEGPAQQLAERGDLVRAVFLGGEEG
ncbi:MAG TPA: ATP-binding protein [Acidimicrobiales bacterium]|nr:ATP-binding protein [Acidimicrobiales bacterium]